MTIEQDDFQLQQTYYWCGPAATRDALTVRKVFLTQQQLATELGTTVNGTASIADVTRVLNAHLGDGAYVQVWIPGPAYTADQLAQFRKDVQVAVSANWALVANVVGNATGADGRVHSYSGGHYVAITGISPDGTQAWVSDIATGQYWMSMDVLLDWIVNRAYARPTATAPSGLQMEEEMIGKVKGNAQVWASNGVTKRMMGDPAALAKLEAAGQVLIEFDTLAQLTDAFGPDLNAAPASGGVSVADVKAAVKAALKEGIN